jgi:hypothetical protein
MIIRRDLDANQQWFPQARFGMFIHFGLYALLGRGEWVKYNENIPREEYGKLAERFNPHRFVGPPGLRALKMTARGKVQVWIDGQPLTGPTLLKPALKPVTVLLRVEQERGCYGGVAFPDPILLAGRCPGLAAVAV